VFGLVGQDTVGQDTLAGTASRIAIAIVFRLPRDEELVLRLQTGALFEGFASFRQDPACQLRPAHGRPRVRAGPLRAVLRPPSGV